MRRVFVAALAAMVVAGLVAPSVAGAPARDGTVPRVVFIVGPSGSATDRYRAEARAAAEVARTYTPDVTELYSPHATWPAVRTALQGASLVVYMGHGNGWPSKYRDSLYPPTQNGFGLNPSPGSGDSKHQYFGESRIAADVRLAKDAVVLLNHLCYASGNSEPGVPEGSLDQARQRVDNFAAGFVAAGASAVVAEAYASPEHMIRAVLRGNRSIESAWRRAPSANGNAFAFSSVRSPGYVAQMDPERGDSGFTRSIVLKAGLASGDVRAGARGSAAAPSGQAVAPPPVPSLVAAGVQLAAPTTDGSTVAGGRIRFKIPFSVRSRSDLPETIQASVRWDAIEVIAPDPASEAQAAGDGEGAAAAPSPDPGGSPAPATSGGPAAPAATEAPAAPAPSEAPAGPRADFGLIVPERVGDVVAPAAMRITRTQMAIDIATPALPGRYRLTVTLHDDDGVAYDASTQAMLPALLVRVTGAVDAGVDAPSAIELGAGQSATIPVWLANLSTKPWGHPAIADSKDPDGSAPAQAGQLTGTWVALGATDSPELQAAADAASATAFRLPAGLQPGATLLAELAVFAPTEAGDYLLVLDLEVPGVGSLAAHGVEPTIIRVSVHGRRGGEATGAAPPSHGSAGE